MENPPGLCACTTLSRVSPERSQTTLSRQGVNAFLALPAAPVLMVLIGSLGTQAAAVIMVVLFRSKLAGMTRDRVIITWRGTQESRRE